VYPDPVAKFITKFQILVIVTRPFLLIADKSAIALVVYSVPEPKLMLTDNLTDVYTFDVTT